MGLKGTSTKKIDADTLERFTFSTNMLLTELREHEAACNAGFRKLKEMGVDMLVGGQGDFIVECIKNAQAQLAQISENIVKVSRILNDRLSKAIEAYKDHNGLSDISERTRQAAANSVLRKQ